MAMNHYETKSRLFPAVIAMLPLIVFSYFLLDSKLMALTNYVFGLRILSYGTVGLVSIFLFMHICRFLGKIYQNIFFKGALYMPTTEYLLYSNGHYSYAFKNKIRDNIEKDFGIKLPTSGDEKSDNLESRKVISEAVSQVRLKVGDGKLLLQHNIEYGFWRNLVGGAHMSTIFSLINIVIAKSHNDGAWLTASIFLSVFFLVIVFSGKFIIRKLGNNYASILLEEYLAL